MLHVTIDDTQLRKMLAEFPGEIKRASRNALNDTVREVQKDFRATLPGKFAIYKKSFVDRQVYIGPDDLATKDKLQARVSITGAEGKASFLTKFEEAGIKRAERAKTLAIPSKDIRDRGGHVKAAYRLKNFLPLIAIEGAFTQLKRKGGRIVGGKTLNLGKRTVGQRGSFLITLKSGLTALAQRVRKSGDVKLLYVFKPETKIPTSLTFERDAMASVKKNWRKHMELAIEHALKRLAAK